jgi:hypothetical protein
MPCIDPKPKHVSPEGEEEEGEERLTPEEQVHTSEHALDHTDTPPAIGALEFERRVVSSTGKIIIFKVTMDPTSG